MPAVILTGPRQLTVADLPPAEPRAGETIVRMHTAGICGTDLHSYCGRNPLLELPRILGHELVGTVTGGDGTLAAGTRVVIDPMITCGQCRPCRIGRRNCCVEMQVLGVHVDGGYRTDLAVPATLLHPLPETVATELGALIEPLTIGANANLRGEVGAGDTVLIQGAGTIGLGALLIAKVRGARVIVADAIPRRLEVARELGADDVIDVTSEDDRAKVLEFTAGEGVGVVIEATGRVDVLRRAFDLVASAGVVVTLLISPDALSLPVTEYLIKKELDFRGSRLNRDLFPEVIELLASGRIDPRPLITHRYPLEEAPEAFAYAVAHPEQALKVLLTIES